MSIFFGCSAALSAVSSNSSPGGGSSSSSASAEFSLDFPFLFSFLSFFF